MREIIDYFKDDPKEFIQSFIAFGSLLVIVFMMFVIVG